MPSGFEIEGRKIIYIIFNSAQSNTSEKPQLKLAICRRHVIAWKRSRITRAYCYRFIIDVRVDEWVTSCRSKLDFPLPTVRANSSHFCSYDRSNALRFVLGQRRPTTCRTHNQVMRYPTRLARGKNLRQKWESGNALIFGKLNVIRRLNDDIYVRETGPWFQLFHPG